MHYINISTAWIAIFLAMIMIYSCHPQSRNANIAVSHKDWAFSHFDKVDSLNPILLPESDQVFECPITHMDVKWEERNVLNPSAIVRGDSVFLFYRAQDIRGTSRIGMAASGDGLHFNKRPSPVFFPDIDSMMTREWNYRKLNGDSMDLDCKSCYFDGVEDPRIVQGEDGVYYMTYTAYNGKVAQLSIASSQDLIHWNKHGLVLKDEQFDEHWSKSGAIVVEWKEGRHVARRIDGKYWMYFGDTELFMATSTDMIHWDVCVNEESNKMISVLHPRMGYFDSRLVEPGPFALYQDEGILLIYNASNAANYNDAALPKYTYAAGQALFDRDEPYRLIDRTASYFIHPDKDYEKIGEVNEVCFVEGLAKFKGQWFLYYGTADSKIAVATHAIE